MLFGIREKIERIDDNYLSKYYIAILLFSNNFLESKINI